MNFVLGVSLMLSFQMLLLSNEGEGIRCMDEGPIVTEAKPDLADDKDFPDWVQRGEYCYGIAVFALPDGSTVGRSLRARIVVVAEEQIRLRAMESVTLGQVEGCSAMAVGYGDTWWEKDPTEVFQTREEADAFLAEKGWLID